MQARPDPRVRYPGPFPHPCSPNPACHFPALGSPVGSCASYTEDRSCHDDKSIIGFSDDLCGRCTASAPLPRFPLGPPPSLLTPRWLRSVRPERPFTYACDASGDSGFNRGYRQCHSRRLPPFSHPSSPEAPSLDRHYPASSVVRASPPPCRPGLTLAGFRLVRAHHRQGFPCCSVFHLTDMPVPIPRRERCGASVACFPHRHRPSPY